MDITQHDPKTLTPFVDNPRTIDPGARAKLQESLTTLGFYKPLLVWEGQVIAGVQRLSVAQEMELAEVPVVTFEGSEKEARIIALSDNTHMGDWDYERLPAFLGTLLDEDMSESTLAALTGLDEFIIEEAMLVAGSELDDLGRFDDDFAMEEPEEEAPPTDGYEGPGREEQAFANFVFGDVRARTNYPTYQRFVRVLKALEKSTGSTKLDVLLTSLLDLHSIDPVEASDE